MRTDFSVNTTTGEVSIPGFVPDTQLDAPIGATHVTMQAALLNLDFSTENRDLQLSDPLNLPINLTPVDVALTHATVSGSGTTMILLQILFFRN